MHECEKCKSENMEDLLIGSDGIFFCRSCWKPVDDENVNIEIKRKFKNENSKRN